MEDIGQVVVRLMLKLSGSLRKLNEEHAPKLFEKVEEDIEYLQSFQNATWHERLQDPHYMKIRRLYEDTTARANGTTIFPSTTSSSIACCACR